MSLPSMPQHTKNAKLWVVTPAAVSPYEIAKGMHMVACYLSTVKSFIQFSVAVEGKKYRNVLWQDSVHPDRK